MKYTTVVLFCVGLAALGCTSSKTPEKAHAPSKKTAETKAEPYHCDAIEGLSVCVEFTDQSKADAACPDFKGKVAAGGCPTDKLSGSCAYDGKVRKYYKAGGSPQGASYAEKHCAKAMKGTFTASK